MGSIKTSFWPWQRILRQIDLEKTLDCIRHQVHSKTTVFVENDGVYLPNSMLKRFGELSGTLNSSIPAIEIGILFKDPTRL